MVFLDVGEDTHPGCVLIVLILFREAENSLGGGGGGERYLMIQIADESWRFGWNQSGKWLIGIHLINVDFD